MLVRFATRPPDVPARRVAAAHTLRPVTLGVAAAAVLLGCGTPGVPGVARTAPAPNVFWTPPPPPSPPPPAPLRTRADTSRAPAGLPSDLAQRVQALTLTDIVDIALRNNTATAAAWADARAAAA